jgi:4-diphosphocytidyl-2-C-methyl-D-erythritol kinase
VAAYHILAKEYSLPTVKIHLHKHVPIGAGMGGGSSDAAFTIKVLNSLFSLEMSEEEMENRARKLGSDCAFFIKNKPVVAVEKGDVFEEIAVDLGGKTLFIIYPEIHISTKEAYSGVVPRSHSRSMKEILSLPVDNWKDMLHNDFEDSLFPRYPALSNIKQVLYNHGAIYASMTGSGSALYGFFEGDNGLKGLFPKTSFKIINI